MRDGYIRPAGHIGGTRSPAVPGSTGSLLPSPFSYYPSCMRVLVTGGAGFIGSHIVEELLARGDDVLVVDDLSTGKTANLPVGAEFERVDIRDPGLVAIAERFGSEAVVHAAAQSSVPASVAEPARDASV